MKLETLNTKINWLPVTEQSFDGSKMMHLGIDPIWEPGMSAIVVMNNKKECLYFGRHLLKWKFRLPRKLKKKVKALITDKLSPAELNFQYEAFKMTKYFSGAILFEKNNLK